VPFWQIVKIRLALFQTFGWRALGIRDAVASGGEAVDVYSVRVRPWDVERSDSTSFTEVVLGNAGSKRVSAYALSAANYPKFRFGNNQMNESRLCTDRTIAVLVDQRRLYANRKTYVSTVTSSQVLRHTLELRQRHFALAPWFLPGRPRQHCPIRAIIMQAIVPNHRALLVNTNVLRRGRQITIGKKP